MNQPPRVYNPKDFSNYEEKSYEFPKDKQNYENISYDFLKSGTIFRGINLKSNSGMAIQSGLDLELEGKFINEISITGALTDKNVPIQPEGNTQQLNEIDKVFITLDMPSEKFTFGDYYLNLSEGRYGNYSRKLQGIKFSSKRGNFENQAAGAVSKGKFHTNKFTGEEGKQGPYQLRGKNGEEAIIVLAGTEQVYINGEGVLRGENNDYTIDYSTGEITFTPDQLITSHSRITVDFQYSDLVYQKNIMMANSRISLLNNTLVVSAQFINESDDKNNPIELELSDADRKLLSKSGDNSESAYKSTIREDSTGQYVFQDSILVYVGKNAGTHSATFYNVGEAGKYRKHYTPDLVYFEYVDKKNPNVSNEDKQEAVYLPAKPLKSPQKQQQYHFRTVWQPTDNLVFNSEISSSYLDKNTFSAQGDNDNRGLAINLKGQYQSPQTEYGKFQVAGNFRNENNRFQAIGRNKSIEYERKWNNNVQSEQRERVVESNLKYNYRDNISLNFEGGQLRDRFNTTGRTNVDLQMNYNWLQNFQYGREDINTDLTPTLDKAWTRESIRAALNILGLVPFYEHYNENRTNDSLAADNFKFYENSIGIGNHARDAGKKNKIDWDVTYHIRDDYKLSNNVWQEESRGEDIKFSGQLNDWKTFTAALQWTKRNKEYYNSKQSNLEYYLMKAQILQRPKKLPYRWQTNFRIDEKYTVKKEKIYYEVDEGEGNYIYDSTYAEYVPHQFGNYILRIRPTNVRRPVTNFKTGFQLRYNGSRLKQYFENSIFTRFSSFTNLRLDQEIENNHQLSNLYRFSLSNIDTNWVNYYRLFQQDIDYDFKSIRGSLKMRYKSNHNISEVDVRGQEERSRDEYSLKYRGPFLMGIKLVMEMSKYNSQRESEISSMRNHDIAGLKLENDLSYRFNNSKKLNTILNFQYDEKLESNQVESFLTHIRFEFEHNFSRKGRTETFVELDQVQVTPEKSSIPWEMSNGRKEGLTFGFGASIEYKIGRHLNLRANYEGWKEPQYDFYQLGNIELRAFF
ncbi:MAG: hypothetical protein K9M80_06140 [Candidatus Marinimicrobia bacterium]|nr:hypothetical protein [Candidatus Neomarinimicrobiota bacterium]